MKHLCVYYDLWKKRNALHSRWQCVFSIVICFVKFSSIHLRNKLSSGELQEEMSVSGFGGHAEQDARPSQGIVTHFVQVRDPDSPSNWMLEESHTAQTDHSAYPQSRGRIWSFVPEGVSQ